ncbi:MAG: phage tail tape measure protein [Xanthobacteraceae bacterium]
MASLTSQLLVRLVDGVSGPAKKAAGALAGIGNAARGIGAAQARLNAAIERNNAAMAAARGKIFDAAAAGYAIKRALTAPISAAAKFETALEDIGQKGEIPRAKLGELGNQIRQIARQTNQAAPQIAKAMDTLVGFGLDPTASAKLLKPIGRAATAYRADVDDLAKAGYAALANLKVPAEDFSKALDAMAKAGKEGAFELRDQARYMPSLGAAYQALGQKGVSAVADLSAALQAVRKGAGTSEEAATNLQNVLQKMTFPETRKKFAKFGVDIRKELAKAAKEGKTPIEALAEITNRTVKGDLSLIGDLFQDSEAQKGLRALIQNLDEYRKIRAQANSASGIVEDDFARRLQTAQGSLDRITSAVENLNNSIGASLLPTVGALSSKIASVMDRFSAFADANPKLTSAIVSMTAAVVGLNVAIAAIRFSALFMKGGLLTMASAALVATGGMWKLVASMVGFAVAPVIAALRGLRTAMIGFAAAAAIAGRGGALAIMGRALLGVLNPLRLLTAAMVVFNVSAMGRALLALLNPLALVRGALIALRFAVISTGIGALLVGIAMAGMWIYNNWAGIKELFAGIGEGITNAFPGAGAVIEKVSSAVSTLVGWFNNLTGTIDAAPEKWRAMGVAIGETIGEVIKWAADLPTKIKDAVVNGATSFYDAGVRMIQSYWDGVVAKFDQFIAWTAGVSGKIWDAISGAATGLYDLGLKTIQNLWDGTIAKFNEFIAWVKMIPSKIIAAIGKIDLSGIIRWPSLPSWLGGGGGKPAAGSAPAAPLAGKRAAGGPISAGKPYLVGEQGPEIVTPSRSGFVHPNGSGGVTFNPTINLTNNFNGTDPLQVAKVVATSLADELHEALRGLQADFGFKFA